MAEGNGKPTESDQDMRQRLERDSGVSLDIPMKMASAKPGGMVETDPRAPLPDLSNYHSLVDRVALLERNTAAADADLLRPAIAALQERYAELNTAFGQLRAYALSLGKQEDYQKTVMERNIRAAAADLAIKSATDETKADAGALTTMAGAWLVWLKGGDQQG